MSHSKRQHPESEESPYIEAKQRSKKPKKKQTFWSIISSIFWGIVILALVIGVMAGGVAGGYVYTLYQELPSISRLEEFSPSLVTKVYDRNGEVIGEFFFEKRALVSFEELPEEFVNALMAVEDKRFYNHFGVDFIGFGRAMIENIKAWRFVEGASTLTQQLTRGLFLSTDKKIDRKLKEWMLAIQIEKTYRKLAQQELFRQMQETLRQASVPEDILQKLAPLKEQQITPETDLVPILQELVGGEQFQHYRELLVNQAEKLALSKRKAKQRILELYANQFYWGHGAYGVQAAAKLYFGKEVEELSLGESAILAGLVQLPAVYSPIKHPDKAKNRQAHVLRRMVAEGYIAEGVFRLTDEALAGIRRQDFPEDLYPQLEALKNREYDTEEEFVRGLEASIGKEFSDQYASMILIHAAETVFKLTEQDRQQLQGLNISDDMYQKLAGLARADYLSKQDFIKLLEQTLGKQQAEEHFPLILQYAQHETAKRAFVAPFTKKEVPNRRIDEAPYFVEHVRQYLEGKYGFKVYQDGLQVYTTLDLHLQDVATAALQKGLRTVQKRHGFTLIDRDKSPEEREEKLTFIEAAEWNRPIEPGVFVHAIVTEVSAKQITVTVKDFIGTIDRKHFEWAGSDATKLVKVDDIMLVEVLEVDAENQTLKLALDMEPLLEGAFVSIEPKTGHILAMVGGYDFYRSKFNRAVQAMRQPGSSFKPFVYLTALERGRTPVDIIVDEEVTFVIDERTDQTWTPKNFGGTHKGPMTLRQALQSSVNVVAAKLIDQIGPHSVVDTARRLGITTTLNAYPSLALGSSEVPLIEMVSGYCTFANQGYRVDPIFVTKVLDRDGNVLEENIPRARQVVAEETTYILVSLMQGVVERGTATAAKVLGRPLAGKTGTTNDSTDALFLGYSPSLVAGVWVGYDEHSKSIGSRETGGRVALPIWIEFMEEALKDTPVEEFPVPAGMSFVQIDPATGLLYAPQCGGEPFTEVFKKGTEPKEYCYQYRRYSYQ